MKITTITNSDALADLAEPWNRLAGDVPFRRWEWLEAWWRHYGDRRRRLFVIALYDQEQLVGLAPWYVERSASRGRVVRFLGSGEVASEYLSLLVAPGREHEIARELTVWLLGEGRPLWDLIELEDVDPEDEAVASLVRGFESRGLQSIRRPGVNRWVISLPESWDGYLARLSRKRREKVRQLGRRVFDTGRGVVRLVETEADLDRGLEILIDLHQRRRQSLDEETAFSSPRFQALHRELALRFLRLGRLRLQWIELDGRPVEVEYQFLGGETVYHYNSGIDPAAEDQRPGWLGISATLRQIIDGGYRHFDFLRGDEPYKANWRGERRESHTFYLVGHRPGSQLRYTLWTAGRRAVDEARRFGRPLRQRLLGRQDDQFNQSPAAVPVPVPPVTETNEVIG